MLFLFIDDEFWIPLLLALPLHPIIIEAFCNSWKVRHFWVHLAIAAILVSCVAAMVSELIVVAVR